MKIRNNAGQVLDVSEELFAEQYELQGYWRDDPEPNLEGMTRDELNAHAASVGVADPESFPNKAALIEAIAAAGDGSEG